MPTKQRQASPQDAEGALDAIERATRRRAGGVRTLLGFLVHPDAEVRLRSAEGLGQRRAEGVIVQGLARSLARDNDELVRATAAESLGNIGDRRGATALRKALNDRSKLVRAYAAVALGELGNRRDGPRLRRRLLTERQPSVRVGLLSALHLLGDGGALTRLLRLVNRDGDYHVRCAASNAVASLPLTGSERVMALKTLKAAAAKEPTIAAASSMATAQRRLTDHQSNERRSRGR